MEVVTMKPVTMNKQLKPKVGNLVEADAELPALAVVIFHPV